MNAPMVIHESQRSSNDMSSAARDAQLRKNPHVAFFSKNKSGNFAISKKGRNFALANGGIAQLVRASDS